MRPGATLEELPRMMGLVREERVRSSGVAKQEKGRVVFVPLWLC